MARRFFPARGRSAARQTAWVSFAPLVDTAAPGVSILIASANAALLALRPFTITRTRLEVEFTSDQTAATELQIAALGLAVVSDEAVAAGIGSIPGPITDIGSDLWWMHQSMLQSFLFVSGVGVQPTASKNYSIDSKAMRKVGIGEDIAFAFEVSGTGGGASVTMMGRMLIKLH